MLDDDEWGNQEAPKCENHFHLGASFLLLIVLLFQDTIYFVDFMAVIEVVAGPNGKENESKLERCAH